MELLGRMAKSDVSSAERDEKEQRMESLFSRVPWEGAERWRDGCIWEPSTEAEGR